MSQKWIHWSTKRSSTCHHHSQWLPFLTPNESINRLQDLLVINESWGFPLTQTFTVLSVRVWVKVTLCWKWLMKWPSASALCFCRKPLIWILEMQTEKEAIQNWWDIRLHSCTSMSCRFVYLFCLILTKAKLFFLYPEERLIGGLFVHVCVHVFVYMCGTPLSSRPGELHALSAFISHWREH